MSRSVVASTLIRRAAQGLGIGVLLTALGCAAFAARGLHTGFEPLDWLLGMVLIALPMVALLIAISLPARILRWLLGRFGFRRLHPVLAVAGHPLLATTGAIAWAVWLSGPDGMYHSMFYFEIPIVLGGVVGGLTGLAVAASAVVPLDRHRPAFVGAAAGLALVLAATSAAWAAFPGFGDGLAPRESISPAIAQLQLDNPSLAGTYAVSYVAYGSGNEVRRPEFGADPTWRTPTIDASAALPDRTFPDYDYARWFWGFDDTALPLNAMLWYPTDAPGPLPVALIVHGNHDAGDFSDAGYAYLCESLASHGIIAASVDENFLNGDSFYDYGGAEMGVRAWFLLRHLDQLRTWNATAGHPLNGRVDLGRVALMGHSRGGEAAAVAAMFATSDTLNLSGMPPTPRGFGIRAVVAIAPSDTMYRGPGGAARLSNIDYLVMQGAHDADLAGFDGLGAYHRAAFSETGHLKAAVYVGRANHGRFNSVWDYGDAGPLSSWLLDRGSLLSVPEQQQVARTVIGAFLARSLLGDTGYDAFFREPRAGAAWLPDDIVETHWETSAREVVDSFGRIDTSTLVLSGFSSATSVDPPLRDKLSQRDRAALLAWRNGASLTLPVGAELRTMNDRFALVFSMVNGLDTTSVVDPLITLTDAQGRQVSLHLADVAPPRPLLPVQLWKLAGLGDRYIPAEAHSWPAERFMQTYELPLGRFTAVDAALDVTRIASIRLTFSDAGSVYLDDVGFEPPV